MVHANKRHLELEKAVPVVRDDRQAKPRGRVGLDSMPLLIGARGHGDAADAALEDLLTTLYEPIRRFMLGRLHSLVDAGDLAADATQEAMVRIAKGVRGCHARTDSELVKWALCIAQRVLVDLYRSNRSNLAALHFAEEAAEEMFGITMDESVGKRAELSPAMEQLLGIMADAYSAAASATGELIWWRLIIGMEWSELGAKFGTSRSGAKRRFERAQEMLRSEVVRRIGLLASSERDSVLAVLARFGYADVLVADQPVGEPGMTHAPSLGTRTSLTGSCAVMNSSSTGGTAA